MRFGAGLAVSLGIAFAGCGGGDDAPVAATPAPTPRATEPPATASRPRPVRLTVAVSGDILPHLPVVQAASRPGGGYDFAPLLRGVAPLVRRADLALCHLEAPLQEGTPVGYPRFRAPPALARGIRRTGWDVCSTASNHTLDQGADGVRDTLAALDAAGVAHAGSATSRQAAGRPAVLRAEGVRVAFLSYTTTTNGLVPPHPWSVDLAEPGRIRRDARRARRAGADAVIVNLHWGTEYVQAPDAGQRRLARALTASRAITAVVGQHAHVVQPIRRVRGRWVVFGTGNLLSNQDAACCGTGTQDGMVALLRLRVGASGARVTRIDYAPTFVTHPDLRVVRARRAGPLSESWHRTVAVVGRGNRLRPLGR